MARSSTHRTDRQPAAPTLSWSSPNPPCGGLEQTVATLPHATRGCRSVRSRVMCGSATRAMICCAGLAGAAYGANSASSAAPTARCSSATPALARCVTPDRSTVGGWVPPRLRRASSARSWSTVVASTGPSTRARGRSACGWSRTSSKPGSPCRDACGSAPETISSAVSSRAGRDSRCVTTTVVPVAARSTRRESSSPRPRPVSPAGVFAAPTVVGDPGADLPAARWSPWRAGPPRRYRVRRRW